MRWPISEQRARRYDAFLTEAVVDLMTHDRRLAALPVQASFDQGVAHLTGEVADQAELDILRNMIGRLDGVMGVWDRVRVAGREPVVLDLGCGDTTQYEGSIGIDYRPTKAVSVVADLTRGLPARSDSVDRIFAVHVLEHLGDYLPLLDECHRVLRPDGVLHVLTPWWRHVNAVADATHVRLFDVQTFKYICRRPTSNPRWTPLHVACDGASVLADLRPCQPDEEPDPEVMDRFFD